MGYWGSRPAYSILLQMAERGNQCFCILVWMVWKDRNSYKALSATLLQENAGSYLFDFQSAKKVVSLCAKPANQAVSNDRWCPPAAGSFKLNTDATVCGDLGFIGVGGVIRDCEGMVL